MKRKIILILAAAASIFAACDKNNGSAPEGPSGQNILYLLNNGSMGMNNSNIGIYDLDNKTLTADAFYAANNFNLGDTGQDILEYNNEIYIAVHGSKIIFVTDKSLKVKKTIEATMPSSPQTKLSPRHLTAGYGKVYVTYYEGFLGEINTADYAVRLTEVGPSPEGLAVCGKNVYVANSGGANYPDYDNTLSVVDLDSFKETRKINVNLNPEFVEVNPDETILFVSSKGNYADVPGTLEAIDLKSFATTNLNIDNLIWMSMGATKLYLLTGGLDENYNPLPGKVYTLDIALSSKEPKPFVQDDTVLEKAYSISACRNGYVFIGSSDFQTNGDVFVFSPDGKLYDKFDSEGINPHKII